MKIKIILAGLLVALPLMADVRVKVRAGPGHPIHRPGRTVIVRPVRPSAVVVRNPIVYAAPVVWTRTVVSLPSRDRLSWRTAKPLLAAKIGSTPLSTSTSAVTPCI